MKKLSFLFISLLAVTLFTSCNKDDEAVSRQTVNMTINNRAIDGEQVVFSQGTAKVELNYIDKTIKFTTDYNDIDGVPHSIITPDMKMTPVSSSVYEFTSSNGNQVGSLTSGTFSGYIDMSTGMTWYTINSGSMEVVSTSHLLYAYSTTDITNPDNDNHGSHQHSAYLFALDSKGETCILQISNFIPNLNGTIEAQEVQYNGLTVTPTATGYKITSEEAESSYKGFFKLTDVDFTLNEQCMVIDGSFKCNDLEFKVTGNLFPED